MQLTTENLSRFKGGQLEVQNRNEGYVYRGEIEAATIEDNRLVVKFSWLASGEGYPPYPTKWVKSFRGDYAASLEIYAASDIGLNRLCLNSPIVGELVVFYPPDGSKLDPSVVEGLQVT